MLVFSEARKCSPTKCFSTVRQKNWRRIVMPTPFLIQNTFRSRKDFEAQWGSSTKCFGFVRLQRREKNFSGESWYASISYARKILILKVCWNTKGFPYEMRWHCEPKTLTRILMRTPFLFLNVFRYRKFSETQKGSSTKRSGTVKQTFSKHNGDVRPFFYP